MTSKILIANITTSKCYKAKRFIFIYQPQPSNWFYSNIVYVAYIGYIYQQQKEAIVHRIRPLSLSTCIRIGYLYQKVRNPEIPLAFCIIFLKLPTDVLIIPSP